MATQCQHSVTQQQQQTLQNLLSEPSSVSNSTHSTAQRPNVIVSPSAGSHIGGHVLGPASSSEPSWPRGLQDSQVTPGKSRPSNPAPTSSPLILGPACDRPQGPSNSQQNLNPPNSSSGSSMPIPNYVQSCSVGPLPRHAPRRRLNPDDFPPEPEQPSFASDVLFEHDPWHGASMQWQQQAKQQQPHNADAWKSFKPTLQHVHEVEPDSGFVPPPGSPFKPVNPSDWSVPLSGMHSRGEPSQSRFVMTDSMYPNNLPKPSDSKPQIVPPPPAGTNQSQTVQQSDYSNYGPALQPGTFNDNRVFFFFF